MKEIICICCPKGCHLKVDETNGYQVTGNGCENGLAYGREELTHPTRIVTSTVRAEGGLHPRCPVKTAKPVPKEAVPAVMRALEDIVVHAPVTVGQVIVKNFCGTGVDLLATRNL